jgi:hypothetical protein
VKPTPPCEFTECPAPKPIGPPPQAGGDKSKGTK